MSDADSDTGNGGEMSASGVSKTLLEDIDAPCQEQGFKSRSEFASITTAPTT